MTGQRHVRIPSMVGVCQRTEQRQDRSSNKPYETQRVPPSRASADSIAAKADKALFSAICMNPNHVLSNFLPRPKQHEYHKRTRAHNFSLPLRTIGTVF